LKLKGLRLGNREENGESTSLHREPYERHASKNDAVEW